MTEYETLKRLVDEAADDVSKAVGGNKAAGTRVRKKMQEIKSAAQAQLFGGTGDAPADACFHLACDTTANIDRQLLGELARAAGWVVGALASGEVDLGSP